MPNYYITVWEWDGEEYVPKIIAEDDSYDNIRLIFDSIIVNDDCAQIDLWECKEDRDEKIDIKENLKCML